MPAKPKNAQRHMAAKPQCPTPVPVPRTIVELQASESGPVGRYEPVVTLPRGDAPRSRRVEAMEKAIAPEDAKIIAKASARALRRGLQ